MLSSLFRDSESKDNRLYDIEGQIGLRVGMRFLNILLEKTSKEAKGSLQNKTPKLEIICPPLVKSFPPLR